MPGWLLVAFGGAIGSVVRYWTMDWVARRTGLLFPYGTLAVNVAGSLAMGALIGLLVHYTPPQAGNLRLFVAVGILGGFTTFSAFSLDTVSLIERGQWSAAALYIALSIMLCIAATFIGLAIVRG